MKKQFIILAVLFVFIFDSSGQTAYKSDSLSLTYITKIDGQKYVSASKTTVFILVDNENKTAMIHIFDKDNYENPSKISEIKIVSIAPDTSLIKYCSVSGQYLTFDRNSRTLFWEYDDETENMQFSWTFLNIVKSTMKEYFDFSDNFTLN